MNPNTIIILILISCSITFSSCESTTSCNNVSEANISAFIRIPENKKFDGGLFFFLVGKTATQSNSEIDKSFRTDVSFPICNWYDYIVVQLDSITINKRYQTINLNPFQTHNWYIQPNKKYDIPEIKKTTPTIQALEIILPKMFDTTRIPISLTWSEPEPESETYIVIVISKNNIITNAYSTIHIIPTDDTGYYNITDEYLKEFNSGDTLKITIGRTWSQIDSLNNKNYLFAHTFFNNLYTVLLK